MKEFELFIDPDRMRALFQRQLPGFSQGGLIITDCRIGYTLYKTYKKASAWSKSSLSICYHLEIHDPSAQRSGAQILYVKAFLGNRSRTEFQKIRAASIVPPRYGEGVVHLPELDMIVWAFPNDPMLSHLPECMGPQAVKRYLPYDHLPPGFDQPEDITSMTEEVVHYRPEARCTIRYRLECGPVDGPKGLVLFGKTFKDDQGKEIYRRMNILWNLSSRDPENFTVAQPLSYSEEIKTVWQSGLQGDPLAEVIDRTNYRHLLEAVASGLARLHKSGLSSATKIAAEDHLREIKKKIAKLTHAFPRFKEPLQSIEQGLEQSMPQWTHAPDRIIHADFSVQQLLVCEEKIACFDFDEFVIGDPTQDIANFIVDLYFRPFDRDLVKLMISRFVHAYEQKAGLEISTNHLNWYVQILFVTKAYRFYLQQRPRIEEEIEATIGLAQKGNVRESCFK